MPSAAPASSTQDQTGNPSKTNLGFSTSSKNPGVNIKLGGNYNLGGIGPLGVYKTGSTPLQQVGAPLGDPLHIFGGSSSNSIDWSAINNAKLAKLSNQANSWAMMFMNNYIDGKLPPDMEAQLTLLSDQTTTAIKNNFSNLGLSGSTMEQSAINYANLEILAEKADMIQTQFNDAMQMFGVDLSALGQQNNLVMQNNEINQQQQTQTMQGIAAIGEAVGMIAMA